MTSGPTSDDYLGNYGFIQKLQDYSNKETMSRLCNAICLVFATEG